MVNVNNIDGFSERRMHALLPSFHLVQLFVLWFGIQFLMDSATLGIWCQMSLMGRVYTWCTVNRDNWKIKRDTFLQWSLSRCLKLGIIVGRDTSVLRRDVFVHRWRQVRFDGRCKNDGCYLMYRMGVFSEFSSDAHTPRSFALFKWLRSMLVASLRCSSPLSTYFSITNVNLVQREKNEAMGGRFKSSWRFSLVSAMLQLTNRTNERAF